MIDLAVKISLNHYNGKLYLSTHIVDVRLSTTDDDAYFKELNDYNLFLFLFKAKRRMELLARRFVFQIAGQGKLFSAYVFTQSVCAVGIDYIRFKNIIKQCSK